MSTVEEKYILNAILKLQLHIYSLMCFLLFSTAFSSALKICYFLSTLMSLTSGQCHGHLSRDGIRGCCGGWWGRPPVPKLLWGVQAELQECQRATKQKEKVEERAGKGERGQREGGQIRVRWWQQTESFPFPWQPAGQEDLHHEPG